MDSAFTPMDVNDARVRVKELERVVLCRPSSVVLNDLAVCYFTLGDAERALPLAVAAWEKNRNAAIALTYALILKQLNRHEESVRLMEAAYTMEPENGYIRMGYSEGLLRAGLWRQAWLLYDNVRPTQQWAAVDLNLPLSVREWQGQPLPEGHQLLVINEGGTGDRLCYARWLPDLSKMGVNWIFYPYAALYSFFSRSLPKERLVQDGDDINPTHWCTAFSLPAKLNAMPTQVPRPLPLTADTRLCDGYVFKKTPGIPVVGLCYEASEKFQGGLKVRSLTEGQAARLVCSTGDKVQWVNLQHGKKQAYPVVNIPFDTWEEQAALIHNLDAVVTVDTATMHLAGSMGKPLAVPLGPNSCWKFLRKGQRCVWYPTARLYRGSDFEETVTDLISAIRSSPSDFCKIAPAV